MKISDQLREEWALIDQPHKWTKGEHARDNAGNWVTYTSKSACKFCQEGARIKVSGNDAVSIGYGESVSNYAQDFANDVARFFGFSGAVHLNDHPNTTHEDMRIFYNTMIYIAEQCE